MGEYVVTARKWRPMKFEDVVGQRHVTSTLRNAIASNRLAHAYLFSGPRGVGKTTTARLLAKAVNCLAPKENNPDNTCEICREITEGRSFDVLEIDGASNRGVDEIRNLRESVRYAPAKGKYKVFVIDEVHMLTKEAFNALLKTLEEPPAHVLFIFATTEIHKVPPTILSRCQRFDFRRIGIDEIINNLRTIAGEEGVAIDADALTLIAKKGDGSLRDAQSIFDQAISLCGKTVTHEQILRAFNIVDEEVYFRVSALIRAKDARGGLTLVDELMQGGHDIREFLSGLTEHFRNLLIAKTTGDTTLIEASDLYRQKYAEEAKHVSVADLLRYQRLVNGTDAALRWSTQPRFKLEADLVHMITMSPAADIQELLQRVDELKKKLDEGPARAGTSSPPPALRPGRAPAVPARTPALPALSEAEVSSRWQEFIHEVRRERISLGSVLENIRFLGVKGDAILLQCSDEFQASSIGRNKEALAEMMQKVFHARARLEVELTPGHAPSSPAEPPAANKPPETEHPILAAIRRELGAEPIG